MWCGFFGPSGQHVSKDYSQDEDFIKSSNGIKEKLNSFSEISAVFSKYLISIWRGNKKKSPHDCEAVNTRLLPSRRFFPGFHISSAAEKSNKIV